MMPRGLPRGDSLKASITGDEDIPINKRGSGVRRLILLSFFRAKAEQLMSDNNRQNAIYAIEEPETSQHPRNQRLLISALQDLAGRDQVIITTHTPMLTRTLPATSIRFIHTEPDGRKIILNGGSDETNRLIANSLGVLPDHTVKLFICVEGKTDIPFLKNIARILINGGYEVPDLEQMELDGEIIFAPLGGSQLAIWCNRLANLNRPEFHLYDRDTAPPAAPKYQCHIDAVNGRVSCKACCTIKREIENYIHYEAINKALSDNGIAYSFPGPLGDYNDVPNILSSALNPLFSVGDKWGDRRAKEFLCSVAVKKMTKDMLLQIDPNREILGWFSDITHLLESVN
jgi:putative ATP-dependent endonuclease of the OLD family